MTSQSPPEEESFVQAVEHVLGRSLDEQEVALAASLQHEKSPEVVAREMEGSVIADPKKIRPEHSDTAKE